MISFLLFLSISSCGPSAAEIPISKKVKADSTAFAIQQEQPSPEDEAAKQRAIADSIAAVTQLTQEAEAEREKLRQDSISAVEKENLRSELIELKTRIKEIQRQLRNY